MADETPVAAPAEAVDQSEREAAAASDKPTDQENENVTTTEEKPTDTTSANDEKKEAENGTEESKTSGDADETKDESAAPPAAADEEQADGAETAAPEANGAPAASKKSSKDRRRSSGVGEKSKLNKRKSMPKLTQLNVKPGEYYLARLRSYAPWPSIICDEEMLPPILVENRPVTAAQPDGTYRADYADDGKRAHERTFPVMFLQSNEFAWIPNTQLTPITPEECKDVPEKGKAKGLIAAYKVAAEGHDLDYFKQMLADHEAAIQQEIEEEEAAEAAKAAAKAEKEAAKEAAKAEKEAAKKATKNKRKSKGAETDVEMEDVDDSKKAKPASKKRKNEVDAEAEKPAKTPKTSTKLKLTTPKAPAEEKKTPASKAKKAATKKSKAAVEEDSTPEAKEPEKQVDPEELRKKKEKEVLFLRHKLQKGFISREMPPQEDEMATMVTYFDKLEKHTDLEVSIIRATKINKVLKMIVKLDTIPRDEEFQFRQRALGILTSWKSVLEADAPAPSDKEAKPATNGAAKEEAADTPKAETEEEKEGESKAEADDTPMPDADADKTEPEAAEKGEAKDDKETEEAAEEKAEDKAEEESEQKDDEKTEEKTEEATE
ncbi:hypothetical protein N7539_008154 [Penicillium diatomitis]|uniref:PWWP domain-containing protein n=1 Tax=Penicillium diatomitis TaxID=2819901 RepID=A0A9W9WTS0_9EURO|nr:uncharacterized protein N7539_008154 [Penicillium diatomitis]KAJ5475088.1 hypothetical protein N7539_008154 [Penicillium diatomitis]